MTKDAKTKTILKELVAIRARLDRVIERAAKPGPDDFDYRKYAEETFDKLSEAQIKAIRPPE